MLGAAPLGFASSGSQQNPYAQGGMGGNKPPQYATLPIGGQNVQWGGGQQAQRPTGQQPDVTWGNVQRVGTQQPTSPWGPGGVSPGNQTSGLGSNQTVHVPIGSQPPTSTAPQQGFPTSLQGGLGGQGAAMFWGMMNNRGQPPAAAPTSGGYGGWVAPPGTSQDTLNSLGNGGVVPGGRRFPDGSFRPDGYGLGRTTTNPGGGGGGQAAGGQPGNILPGGGGNAFLGGLGGQASSGGQPGNLLPGGGGNAFLGGMGGSQQAGVMQHGSYLSGGQSAGQNSPGVLRPMMSGGNSDGSGSGYRGPPTSDVFTGIAGQTNGVPNNMFRPEDAQKMQGAPTQDQLAQNQALQGNYRWSPSGQNSSYPGMVPSQLQGGMFSTETQRVAPWNPSMATPEATSMFNPGAARRPMFGGLNYAG